MLLRIELLTPGPDHHGRQHLQPHVHAARRGHDLPVHDPGHPGRLRQLPAAADAGGQGRGLPASSTCCRSTSTWPARRWRCSAWSWAAPTRAGRSTPRTARRTPTTLVPVLLGVFIIGFSSIITGLNFIVTIHTLRAPGMSWMRMPLFVWAIYATSIIQVLATPVIGLTVMLVGIEQVGGFGLFDPARGGDPVLFQHMFWFYSHPAVYIMVLPAMGVMTEVVARLRRKNIFGYKMIAYSLAGHRLRGLLRLGPPHVRVGAVDVRRRRVRRALDAGRRLHRHQGLQLGGDAVRGAIAFTTPFVYFCGFLFFLVFGGMTGIAVATMSLDVHWHDTYFVVAHFHFIMVGAVIMAFLAALHYWFPKMFGRMYHEGWGMVAAALIILGFNATFIPQFLLGQRRACRGATYKYPERFQALNVASTAGASLLAFGFVIILDLPDLRAGARRAGRATTPGARAGTSGRPPRRRRSTTSTSRRSSTAGLALLPGAGRGGGACRHLRPRLAATPRRSAPGAPLRHHREAGPRRPPGHVAVPRHRGAALRGPVPRLRRLPALLSRGLHEASRTWTCMGTVNTWCSSPAASRWRWPTTRKEGKTSQWRLLIFTILCALRLPGHQGLRVPPQVRRGRAARQVVPHRRGARARRDLFYTVYFLATGLHAFHVIIGMSVLSGSWPGR